jgi:23S rRNA pseudouridine1911/1915/1917 synthase
MTGPDEQPDLIPQPEAEDADADVRHFQWKVTKNLTRRIDQYLVDRVGYLSRNGVQKLMDEGLVKVNGRIIKASYKPRDGDVVTMVAPPEPVNELTPEPIPLDIVYEDEYFLALNKQADLIVHPARGRWSGTLVNGLVYYGNRWSKVSGEWRPGILHRLDRNTTGIMLVAKADEAHWRLARQFENRTIQKTYLAVCHGVPELLNDVIDMPIGQDRYIREKQAVRKESSGGKPATTIYEVQEIFNNPEPGPVAPDPGHTLGASPRILPSPVRGDSPLFSLHRSTHPKDQNFPPPPGRFSLIKLSPKTGRTHQLRVHMSHRGFPMVGDTMYGGHTIQSGEFRFERQALHAYQITFVHPVTLQTMTLTAPVPPDIQRLIEILRGG